MEVAMVVKVVAMFFFSPLIFVLFEAVVFDLMNYELSLSHLSPT